MFLDNNFTKTHFITYMFNNFLLTKPQKNFKFKNKKSLNCDAIGK